MNKSLKLKRSAKIVLASILAAMTLISYSSCSSNNGGNIGSADTSDETTDTLTGASSSKSDDEEPGKELKPTGEVDSDAEEIEGIAIRSAADLSKIGKSAKYPTSGNYVLVADIDLSSYGTFTPIAGSVSECGIVKGANVFSGTFDGRGHTITGLSINVSSEERVHVGLFGSVGSSKKNSPAVIKDLILKDVEVTGSANGPATYGVLAGQVSGYAKIDNIAILSGKVEVDNNNGDILGIAALIGQCRTQTSTGCSNQGIHITNIFTNVSVSGDNNRNANYTSGLIGRVRGSNIGTLSNILQIGTVTHEGNASGGNAISTGDAGAVKSENVYYLKGCGTDRGSFGKAKTYEHLTDGTITLDAESWHIAENSYPLLKNTYNSALFSVLDFVSINLSNGESSSLVKSDFTLTDTVMGKSIKWKSSDEKVIKIDGNKAAVTKPKLGYTDVVLTARADGITKSFTLRVSSGVKGEIVSDGAGTLSAKNYPEGVTYKWVVLNASTGKTVKTASSTEKTFTLEKSMKNCIITLKVDGYDDISYYNSTIPTVVINSDTSYYNVSKGGYSTAGMTVYNAEGYPETNYNNDILIKLRGNSTAYQAKRPFKLKLSKKTDMFGMGKSKHWVLLANAFDRTNLRNKLSYDFGADLGVASCESILVNVIFNGEYYGLYQFCENIRVDSGRVEIFDWEDTAEDVAKAIAAKESLSAEEAEELAEKLTRNLAWVTSGKFGSYNISDYYDTSSFNINGGYLIENDFYYDEYSKFTTTNDMKLMIKSPEYAATNQEMMKEISGYIQDMEDAIYSHNRLNSDGKHYSEYMDVNSFIDFWMVNQVFKNVELLYKSCYMYKDIDGLLVFGPIWDMDWTSGNHVNLGGNGGKYNTWWHSESQDREYWYRALYDDPYFIINLYERWNEIQDKIDNIFTQLDSLNEQIADVAAIDNKRWGYDWKYDKEVSTLRKWLSDRRDWMNKQFETPDTLIRSFDYYQDSKNIGITGVYEGSDYLDLYITVLNDKFVSCDLLINGKVVREEAISNGCKIRVQMSELREAGKYNSIEIIGKNANGDYVNVMKRGGQRGANIVDADFFYYLSK